MQFMIITKAASPPPPEMLLPLNDAMAAWLAEHRGSGKMTHAWSFGGMVGGGGILDVESHEELDAIMLGFPWGPFSTVEVYPLADLDASLAAGRAVAERMMEQLGGQS